MVVVAVEEEDVSSISPFVACAKVDNVAASTTSAAAVLINSPFATCFPMPAVPMSEALSSSSFRNIITGGGGGGCVGGLARSVGAGTANVFGKFSSLTPPPVAVDSLTATWLPADGIIIRAVVAVVKEEEAGPSWASDEFSEL